MRSEVIVLSDVSQSQKEKHPMFSLIYVIWDGGKGDIKVKEMLKEEERDQKEGEKEGKGGQWGLEMIKLYYVYVSVWQNKTCYCV